MKKIFSMLTASVMSSVLLTGCGVQQEVNPDESEMMPDIQISTIEIETQNRETVPQITEEEPTTEAPVLSTEAPQYLPSEITIAPEKPKLVFEYDTVLFDKAIFAAILDGLTQYPVDYLVSDPDRDGISEFLVSLPVSETASQNLVFEGLDSSGLYYYDATGIENDFYVIDPLTGEVYLNENTRPDNGGNYFLFQEYFHWTGANWQSACMLSGNNCYWNYQKVSAEEFRHNADTMQHIATEDIFNVSFSGSPETAADAFYQYLSRYFKTEKPVSADIDGNGTAEYFVSVQNLSKPWYSNVKNLYEEKDTFEEEPLVNMHTTCFVFDITDGAKVRIRSENFDRRYLFRSSGGKLFAYDDTNTIQTVQYSDTADGLGVTFLSVSMMMG